MIDRKLPRSCTAYMHIRVAYIPLGTCRSDRRDAGHSRENSYRGLHTVPEVSHASFDWSTKTPNPESPIKERRRLRLASQHNFDMRNSTFEIIRQLQDGMTAAKGPANARSRAGAPWTVKRIQSSRPGTTR